MYKSLGGSKFFRTTTGIKSGPDALDESKIFVTFLTILGVTGISSFRLVLKRKMGKGTPESSRLEKFLANVKDNTSELLN